MKPAILLLPALLAAAAAETKADSTLIKPEAEAAQQVMRLPVRTAPAEHAEIFSRATGIIAERRVDIGDRVAAGDVLAVIEAPEIPLGVERAEAAVAQAEARAALARTGLQRAREMAKSRVIAQEALDEREAGAKTAEADLLAAKAELHRAQELVKFLTIRAPFDGLIAARRVDRGDHIRGDQSQPGQGLFEVVRIDELRVEVNAPPSAALRIAPGQQAGIEFPEMPGRTFDAVVARSSGVIDRASGTMRFELALPNTGNPLPPGLTGTASLRLSAGAGVLLVPASAIVVRGGVPHVAKLEDGRIRYAPVTTGRNLEGKIEILGGVSVEDTLIPSPNALLADGDPFPGS
jgi:RND family efflux transporter MFP subunit